MQKILDVWVKGEKYTLWADVEPQFLFLTNQDDEGMELTREAVFTMLDKHFKDNF